MPEQGETYAAFIATELRTEDARRQALDTKAAGIATTSSAFLVLVFTLSALVTGKDHAFTTAGVRGVVAALALYVGAAVLGLLASMSRSYDVTSAETLDRMVDDHWQDDEVDARNQTAYLNIRTIATLRDGNNRKASMVGWAMAVQVAASVLLVLALAWELGPLIR